MTTPKRSHHSPRDWRPVGATIGLVWMTTCTHFRGDDARHANTDEKAAFVSVHGDDRNAGTKSAPYRTLARAMLDDRVDVVSLAAGHYDANGSAITRVISWRGEAGTVIAGAITVQGGGGVLELESLVLRGSGAVRPGGRLRAQSATIASGDAPFAVHATTSTVILEQVHIECAGEVCIDLSKARLDATDLHMRAPGAKRGLRADRSRVNIKTLEAMGSRVVSLHATNHSHVELVDVRVSSFSGSGIAILNHASLVASDVTLDSAARVGVLVSEGRAEIRGLIIGDVLPAADGVAIEGSAVHLEDVTIVSRGQSAIRVNNKMETESTVDIDRAQVHHGQTTAVQVGGGRLRLSQGVFVGDDAREGADAVNASGPASELVVESCTLTGSSGYGIGVYNDAFASLNAIIDRPRLGGILVQETVGERITIVGTRIRNCRLGSGVIVDHAQDVEMVDTEITKCPEGGLLVVNGGDARARGSRFLNNGQYGVGVFGKSRLELGTSTIRGSPWAMYASCGDGAELVEGDGNVIDGPRISCL